MHPPPPSIHPSLPPSIPQSLPPSIPPSLTPSLNPSLNPSIPQSLNPSITPSLNPSLNHPITQSLNPSITQSLNHSITRPSSPAFTLIELLTAILVLLLLALLAVPAYRHALAAAQSATCRSNLRQLATAALGYARDHGGEFPWAVDPSGNPWDFARSPQTGRVVPGPLWDYTADGASRVLQCPAIAPSLANWRDDPATGYNYNSSFIGKVAGEAGLRTRPANAAVLSRPARTALFGDGQYSRGANKFMRAPLRDPAHDASSASLRRAGTQGFRHNGKTNVAFADGHVESLSTPYTPGSTRPAFVSPPCAFLSPDNSLYAP